MAAPTKHVIIALGVGLAAIIGYGIVDSKKSDGTVVLVPRDAKPPEDAHIRTDLAAHRVIADSSGRDAAPDLYSDVWIGGSGWSMEVMATNRYQGELLVDMYQTHTSIIGNGYWVRATLPDPNIELKRGDVATLRGRISIVDRVMSGPIHEYRVILDPAEIIDVQLTGR